MAWSLSGRHGQGGFPFLGGLCHTLVADRGCRLRDKDARSTEGSWEKGEVTVRDRGRWGGRELEMKQGL